MEKQRGKSTKSEERDPNLPAAKELFGQMMRGLREPSGMTLEQLSEITRISVSFLAALESGNIKEIPGPVFGRGFIRCVCKLFQVDAADYLQAYELACQEEGLTAPALRVPAQEGIGNRHVGTTGSFWQGGWRDWLESINQSSWKNRLPVPLSALIAGALVVVLLPLALSYLSRPSSSEIEPVATTQIGSMTVRDEVDPRAIEAREEMMLREVSGELTESTAENSPSQPDVQVSKGVSGAETPGQPAAGATAPAEIAMNTDAAGVNSAGKQRIHMRVLSPVKIRIKQDSTAWATMNLEPGEYDYEFGIEAQFLIFDAAAVEVQFNGKPLGSLGQKGRVRRLSFAASADYIKSKRL